MSIAKREAYGGVALVVSVTDCLFVFCVENGSWNEVLRVRERS